MTSVCVLGSSGMLGSMLAEVLRRDPRIELTAVSRSTHRLDARRDDPAELIAKADCAWILNAIGVTRARIDESDAGSVAEAFAVNAEFPRRLASAAAINGSRVIHFSTDAVFSGTGAPHDEWSAADAEDVYGRSKREGEAEAEHVLNLRCSIVGPEPGEPNSLLGWALSRQPGARIPGYEDRLWNGLTSLHLARVCAALVGAAIELSGPLHLVAGDSVSKATLLELILGAHDRQDVTVERGPAPTPADMRLATIHPQLNGHLFKLAGYSEVPTVATMVSELAGFGPYPFD